MDMTARRRAGKGIGADNLRTETLPLTDFPDSEVRRDREVQRSGHDSDEPVALRESGGNQLDRARGSSSVGEDAPVNPFWSERQQDEVRLQAARPNHLPNPDFLGNVGAQRSGNSSTSTELRPAETLGVAELTGPRGYPVAYGPAALRTTVAEGVHTVRDGVTSPAAPGVTSESDPAERAVGNHEEGHGLSVRERTILLEMKNAMVRISEQNEQLANQNDALWNRVLRLEEERSTNQTAWQSAEEAVDAGDQFGSGSLNHGSQVTGEVGAVSACKEEWDSIRYEEGYQQGSLAAKEVMESMGVREVTQGRRFENKVSSPVPSFGGIGTDRGDRTPRTPPANPNRTFSVACTTTPQGTPIPQEPHPDECRGVQIDLGSSRPLGFGGNDQLLSPTVPAFPGTIGGLGGFVPSPPPPPQSPPSPPKHEGGNHLLPALPEASEGAGIRLRLEIGCIGSYPC